MQAERLALPASTAGVKSAGDRWYQSDRIGGLRRFATAITLLSLFGHLWLGFEQAWAHPLVALATGYSMELLLELVRCLTSQSRPRFLGGVLPFIDFLLPAHITGLACSMLLYANDRLGPIVFAVAVAIASKHVLRLRTDRGVGHVFNPSNFGITVTLLLFPWVGIAQPYQFTENLGHIGDWVLPGLIICSGTFLNWRFTKRLPLIAAWLSTFILQAVVRHLCFESSLPAVLMPMTGVTFILYSFYMVTDPPTTPASLRGQLAFGAAVGTVYGLLMVSHIVFGLFFSLTIVSTARATCLVLRSMALARLTEPTPKATVVPASLMAAPSSSGVPVAVRSST